MAKFIQVCGIVALFFIALPLSAGQVDLALLKNIRDIHPGNQSNIVTSGMPTEEQFAAIKGANVQLVINLVPDSERGTLPNEALIAKQHELKYVNIPVVAMSPSKANLDAFFQLLDEHRDENVLVHCKSNHRSSAFVYLYALYKQSKTGDIAPSVALKIMEPWGNLEQSLNKYPVWKSFIADMSAEIKK